MKPSRHPFPMPLGGLPVSAAVWHEPIAQLPEWLVAAGLRAFGGALLLFVIATLAEFHDHEIAATPASSNRNVQ